MSLWQYPENLSRILLPGVPCSADPANNRVYLTYDDGPDPDVTPQLLEILAEFNAQATFFVLASDKPWWPELIRNISAAGHKIALHGVLHRSVLFLSNSKIEGELEKVSNKIMSTGAKALPAYRPPFGHIRPDTVNYLKQRGIHTILWSKMPGDFRRISEDRLFARAIRNLRPGDVVALHDGTTLRPAPVLQLTKRLLTEFQKRNWRSAALELPEMTPEIP